MAEATKTTREITTTEESFTLTLSAEEFAYLRNLMGNQPGGDGNGASVRIWDAMKAPTDPASQTFESYDSVTVLPQAVSAGGSRLGIEGRAVVASGPDEDGDYFVRSSNGIECGYVLPQFLRKR